MIETHEGVLILFYLIIEAEISFRKKKISFSDWLMFVFRWSPYNYFKLSILMAALLNISTHI